MSIQGEKILGTAKTPEIILSPDGIIIIKGRWMMENSDNFSKILSDWYDTYIFDLPEITSVNVFLEYFCSLNLVILISLLRKMLGSKLMQKELTINWFYEEGDDDILDIGEYISSILGASFNFIMVSDNKHSQNYPKVQVY
jgi:hypothetical protein